MGHPQKATYRKPSRVVCALCGDEFATSAEHEEHKKIVHNTMDKKTTLSGHQEDPREASSQRHDDARGSEHRGDPRDLEPADNTPTTELPPGTENNVSQQGGSRPSGGHVKSKGAGR